MTIPARLVQLALWLALAIVIAPSRVGIVEIALLIGGCLGVVMVGLTSIKLILSQINKSFRR